MSINDAYVELGLEPGASDVEVKRAWRRMVSRWHPDRNASAEAAALIQRINGAYERIRLATVSSVDETDGVEAAAADEGRVLQRRVRLSIEDAVLGGTRQLRGRWVDTCVPCNGRGMLGQPQSCPSCRGSGRRRQEWWRAWPPTELACDDCQGRGERQATCPACDGGGQQTWRYRCTVRLPAGLRTGDVLMADGGGRHRGGFDGRLELRIELAAHPLFEVDDDGTLRCQLPVDGFAWLAQRWIEVPSPSGLQQMRLRRGRLVYRLPGQGMPLARGSAGRGDYLVTVAPIFPDHSDAEQQALLERLATIAEARPEQALTAWRQRLTAWERSRRASR